MGPLTGYRIIEMTGLGPAPMAGMLLADMGAEVICIDRGVNTDSKFAKDMSRRGKQSIILNLKTDEGRAIALQLIETADALIEGFRPGVMEKLGLSPTDCHQRNPRLVYGRMTGWGQTGPLAQAAGHDINYISINGCLHAIGSADQKPVPPLNLVGDFGGGSLFLTMGVLAALLETQKSGEGQVVDAAMVDGAANLMWMCHSFAAAGFWDLRRRGSNWLDGGAYFYDTYETSDQRYMAVGSLEPQFFQLMVDATKLDQDSFNTSNQMDRDLWSAGKEALAKLFKLKTRDQWAAIFEGTDACVSPVLSALEAPHHPHNVARESYQQIDGYAQPAPAPRFSRTNSSVRHGQHQNGEDTLVILHNLGKTAAQIKALQEANIVTATSKEEQTI